MRKLLCLLAASCLFVNPASAEEPKVEAGFVSLFDGKTLKGWHLMNDAKFSAKDGVILLDRGAGWLRSDKDYQDFELRLDFRFVSKGADSGIFIRAGKEGKNWPDKNYQVQTMDNETIAKLSTRGLSKATFKRDEDLMRKVRKATGEWQSYAITAKGSRVEIKLNDELVTTADGLSAQPGYIGLQGEGGVLEFKNLRIRDLMKNSEQEAFSKTMSLKHGAAFLDRASLEWTNTRKCGTCHTNYIYLVARPSLNEPAPAMEEVRKFFEGRVANWDKAKPRWDAEVVMTGATLALNDAQTTKKLHPLTRVALDRLWTVQQADGGFKWIKCNWPPFEHDDYFGALITAVGVGQAPDAYAKSAKAEEGLSKLRGYFAKNPPPDLHHAAWLLWAARNLDGLMSDSARKETVEKLLAKHNSDGGWAIAGLAPWKRHSKQENDAKVSDPYATGLVLYVLSQANVPVSDAKVSAGLDWLRKNQRESGRWFTRSPSNDNHHFITHTGTAFAVMALRAYGEPVK